MLSFTVMKQNVSDKVLKLFGPGPFSKEERANIRKVIKRKLFLKRDAKTRYVLQKITFEKNRVSLRIPGYNYYRKMLFKPAQILVHVPAGEIRKAVIKHLKIKNRYLL